MSAQAEQATGSLRAVRSHRGAPVQPDVQDLHGSRRGHREYRFHAPGDGAGHLRQLSKRRHDDSPEASLRHRADGQVVSQRDHAGQLPLPHARVRADGDGVLRQARRGRGVVRLLGEGATRLVFAPRNSRREPAPARARSRTSSRTTRRAASTSSTSSRSAGRSSRESPTAPISTSDATRSSAARTCATSTRRVASTTSPTSSSPLPAPTGRLSPSWSTPTTRTRPRGKRARCCACTRNSRRSRRRSSR